METELGLDRQMGFGTELRPGGGKPRTHAEQKATSQVRLKKRPGKGPGLPRAESHLYFAVSAEAPEEFRGQQGFKMTSQPTAVFPRGQRGMAPFPRAGAGVIGTKKHPTLVPL